MMSPKVTNALMAFVGSFVFNVIALKLVPSAMAQAGWIDTLFPPGMASIGVALVTFGYQTTPVQRMMGRVP
jgi:steroid 5-alpha reductase family enzyme